MDLFDTSILGVEKAMQGSLLQQQVLANNIANANTPGYQRSDVDFQSALAQAFAQGSPAPSQIESLSFQPQADATGTEQIDGNGVDVDGEMAHLTQNSLVYAAASQILASRLGMLRSAISGR